MWSTTYVVDCDCKEFIRTLKMSALIVQPYDDSRRFNCPGKQRWLDVDLDVDHSCSCDAHASLLARMFRPLLRPL